MQTVLKHAKIYTGSSVIDDGYLRFDSQLIAVGPIEEYQPNVNDEKIFDLAGSVLQYQDAFRNIMKFTGCGITEAVLMSAVNQAKEFGLKNQGTLEVGKDADLNISDRGLNLKETYSLGRRFLD